MDADNIGNVAHPGLHGLDEPTLTSHQYATKGSAQLNGIILNLELKFRTMEDMQAFMQSQNFQSLKTRMGSRIQTKWWGRHPVKTTIPPRR